MTSKSLGHEIKNYISWFDLVEDPKEETGIITKIKRFGLLTRIESIIRVIFLPLLFIAIICGYIGYHLDGYGYFQSVYMTVRMFLLTNSLLDFNNVFIKIGNYFAFLIKFYVLAKLISKVLHEWINSIYIHRSHGHIVICGLSEKGLELVYDFRRRGEKVLIVELDENNELISEAERVGAITVIGDATDESLLNKVRVGYAKYVIVVTDDDSVNISIALSTYGVCKNCKGMYHHATHSFIDLTNFTNLFNVFFLKKQVKTRCVVHLQNLELIDLFEHHKIFTDPHPIFKMRLFSIYENIARYLYFEYPPYLLTDSLSTDSPPVHFLIINFNPLTESIILQNTKIGHYLNGQKCHYTIIDPEYEKKKKEFYGRYPEIDKYCVITHIAEPLDEIEFSSKMIIGADNKIPFTSAIVCEEDDLTNIKNGLVMLKKIDAKDFFIFIHLKHDLGISLFLDEKFDDYSRLIPFGMMETISTSRIIIGEKLNALAKVIHRNYNESLQKSSPNSANTTRKWDDLTNEIKMSNKQQADHISVKIHMINAKLEWKKEGDGFSNFQFTEKEIETLSEIEHRRWMINKLIDGWKYGNIRDDKNKIHPDIIPYSELDENAKIKDRNVITNIPQYLDILGLKIVRL